MRVESGPPKVPNEVCLTVFPNGPALRRALLFPPLLLLLEPAMATAQAPPESTAKIEEVMVVGRRDTLGLGAADLQSTVLAYDEQVSLSRTPGDWLALMPGVSLNGQGGLLQSYSIRGFSRARIRTELAGVPILTDRRAGTSASFVPPDLLAAVRVDRSAASALYGSGAMGGVVSLSPVDIDGPRVTADLRNNDGQAALTVLAGDSRRLAGGLSVRRGGRGESADGAPLNTAFRQIAGLLQAEGELESQRWSLVWMPSLGRDIGRSNSLYPDRRVSTAPKDDHSVTRLEVRDGNRWLLRTYHHYDDWTSDVLRVGSRRNLTSYRAHTLGALAHASLSLGPARGAWGLEWLGREGVEITDSEFSTAGDLLQRQTVLDADEHTLGAFIDQAWSIGGLEFQAGLRGDYQRQAARPGITEDGQGSGSLRATYLLKEGWSLAAEAATGYRFPSLSERYFTGTTPRGEVQGNPDLDPETRRSVELALLYEAPTYPLRFQFRAYRSDLQDYIERYLAAPELTAYRNLPRAHLQGIEGELRLRRGAWTHALTYQWQTGEDAEGNRLLDLNPPEWRYALTWSRGTFSLMGDLRQRPAQEDPAPGETPLGDATLLGLRATSGLAGGWQAEVYATNLLNETYRSSADDLAPLQPGRTVGLRLSWVPPPG